MAGSKGGRGGKAGSITVAPQSRFAQRPTTVQQTAPTQQAAPQTQRTTQAQQNNNEWQALRDRVAKIKAKTGTQVQDAYIDALRIYHGIDLTNARDTYFDNRRSFNIDTRQLNPSVRSQIRGYLTNVPMFDVQVLDNGAYRLAIVVKKK